jgi:hypothetical protein
MKIKMFTAAVVMMVFCFCFVGNGFANPLLPGNCNGEDNCNNTTITKTNITNNKTDIKTDITNNKTDITKTTNNKTDITNKTNISDNQIINFGGGSGKEILQSSGTKTAPLATAPLASGGSGGGTTIDQLGVIMKGDNNKVAIGDGAVGEDNRSMSQDVQVTVGGNKYEDKRDLIDGPILSFPDAKLSNEKANTIKTKGSIFKKTKTLTAENVKMLLNGSTSVNVFMGPKATVEVRKLINQDFITDQITYGKPNGAKVRFIGSIYVISEGTDLIALEALGARSAMDLGGTHLIAADTDTFITSTGDAKGFSIGGSGSGFAKGDDIAIAPGAMIGWSKNKASNEALASIVYDVYCDDTILIKP